MKKLQVNQMENLEGGLSPACKAEMGLGAVFGGIVGGPWGYAIGMTAGYFLSDKCQLNMGVMNFNTQLFIMIEKR